MKQHTRWKLAGMSASALAAALAALGIVVPARLVLYPALPAVLSSPPGVWLPRLGVGVVGSLAAVWVFVRCYGEILGYGAKLHGGGRERPLAALAVGLVPWLLFAGWLWLETR